MRFGAGPMDLVPAVFPVGLTGKLMNTVPVDTAITVMALTLLSPDIYLAWFTALWMEFCLIPPLTM